MNRAELATTVDRNRREIELREGGPCGYCGVTRSALGTRWHNVGKVGPICGSCQSHFNYDAGPGLQMTNDAKRDLAAKVLAGLRPDSSTGAGIGAKSGVVFFHESGRKRGGRNPWAHLDLAKVRQGAIDHLEWYGKRGPVAEVLVRAESGRRIVW